MRLLALLTAGLFAAVLPAGQFNAADDKGDQKVKDEEAIVGTWKAEKMENGSKGGASPEYAASFVLTFKTAGKLVTTDAKGKEEDLGGSYKLDPSAKPKTLDWSVAKGGSSSVGIYELDGDTLRLCFCLGGGTTRPTEYKAVEGEFVVVTMKRVKSERKDDKKDK